MRTKVSVALNGQELHALDEAIILQSVQEQTPAWNISAADRAGGTGQRLTGFQRRYRDILIQFAIDDKNILRREEILQKVAGWGNGGGSMTVNYRDRQRLRVICTALPAVTGVEKLANVFQINFRALNVPMWEDIDETAVTVSSTASGSASMRIRANGGGKLRAEATNSSGNTCDTVTISAGGRSISFAGLGLANGETLIMDYTAEDIQRIRIRNGTTYRSVMDKRTAGQNSTIISADDILLSQGVNTITVTSGQALEWKLYTFGRWIG